MNIAGLQRALAARVNIAPVRIPSAKAVVSFSFDDFPQSAAVAGARILDQASCRGTYYCAGALLDTLNDGDRQYSHADMLALHRGGHEIACHTYAHADCQQLKPHAMVEDLARNSAFIEKACGAPPENFSFPFGMADLPAKRVAAGRFRTARGIRPGINEGTIDRAQLLANSVYASSYEPARLAELIERNAARGGWLIFYTHDVSDSPGPYGCTEAMLRELVQRAAASGCQMLSVGEAAEQLGIPAVTPAA